MIFNASSSFFIGESKECTLEVDVGADALTPFLLAISIGFVLGSKLLDSDSEQECRCPRPLHDLFRLRQFQQKNFYFSQSDEDDKAKRKRDRKGKKLKTK